MSLVSGERRCSGLMSSLAARNPGERFVTSPSGSAVVMAAQVVEVAFAQLDAVNRDGRLLLGWTTSAASGRLL